MLDQAAEITAIDSSEGPRGETHAFVIGRAGGEHLIGCSATGGYRFDIAELRVDAVPVGPSQMWEHRLLSVIIPIMLAGRGDLVLHAAIVEIDGAAVLLCGPPMRGKSTLALTFAELGHGVLSEDGAIVEPNSGGWTVWPAASGARIRPENGGGPSAKVVTDLPGPEAGALRPGALVLLEPRGDSAAPSVLDPSVALVRMVPHLMHAGGAAAVGPAFSLLAAFLGDVPALRASMPDDLRQLPGAAAALAQRIGRLSKPL